MSASAWSCACPLSSGRFFFHKQLPTNETFVYIISYFICEMQLYLYVYFNLYALIFIEHIMHLTEKLIFAESQYTADYVLVL